MWIKRIAIAVMALFSSSAFAGQVKENNNFSDPNFLDRPASKNPEDCPHFTGGRPSDKGVRIYSVGSQDRSARGKVR